jgi:hypothetical protein
MIKEKTIKLPWNLFKNTCKFYGTFRVGNACYFDEGVCREGYSPKKCYTKRCPIVKGNNKI